MRKLLLIFGLLTLTARGWACLDCSNSGTDAVFSGSVTAGGFAGPTIDELRAQANASRLRSYDLYIGSFGANGVEIASNTSDGLRDGLTRMCGSAVATSCGKGGSILQGPGTYVFNSDSMSIPSGVKIYTTNISSTIWKLGSSTISFGFCNGEIDGVTFSGDNKAFVRALNYISTGCRITNAHWIEAGNMPGTTGASILNVTYASHTFVQGSIDSYAPQACDDTTLDCPVIVDGGRDNTFQLNFKGNSNAITSNATVMVRRSTDTYFQDGYWEGTGGIFFRTIATRNLHIRRNTIERAYDGDTTGYFNFSVGGSSGVFFTRNNIIFNYSGVLSDSFLKTDGTKLYGLQADGNIITARTNTTATVFNCDSANVVNFVLKNNSVQDSMGSALTYLTDSGCVGTKNAGNDNHVNGVEP